MVDYAIRATDNKGEKLPKTSLMQALVVATGAGFTTTSSLLSWLIYGIVTYPGVQEKLLQELIDNGIDADTQLTADLTDRLTFIDKFIKETHRRHNPPYQPARFDPARWDTEEVKNRHKAADMPFALVLACVLGSTLLCKK
ncbi:hypothetical protein CDV55_105303 [Aspergillus turcosus]|nr:hypothetical protein CDV55_105303 [Aspergillus turcosus]